MKRILTLATAALIMTAAASASAQTRPGTSRPAAPQPTPAITSAVPVTKIGMIDTSVFADETNGIKRYVNAFKGVQSGFQPRLTELNTLQSRIKAIADDISKLNGNPVVDPQSLKNKQDESDRLQREFKYKKEQADADFDKRLSEVVGPISTDIGKALDQFASQHGLTMILDISKLLPAVLTLNPAMDITQAFIADYNSKHP